MQDLFYVAVSQSLTLVKDNSNSDTIFWLGITALETSASAYDTSGSIFGATVGDLRIYAYSGSELIATFPQDGTNIYYGPSPVNNNSIFITVTESIHLSNFGWGAVIISGNTSSGYSLYDTTMSSSIVSGSVSNGGGGVIYSLDNYILSVYSSGSYDAKLKIRDTTSGSVVLSISSSDTPLSSSFTPLDFHDYEISFSVVDNSL